MTAVKCVRMNVEILQYVAQLFGNVIIFLDIYFKNLAINRVVVFEHTIQISGQIYTQIIQSKIFCLPASYQKT